MTASLRAAFPAALCIVIGCRDRVARPAVADSLPRVAVAPAPYRVVGVHDGGRVTGRVTVRGDPAAESLLVVTQDADVCGDTARLPQVERAGDRVRDVVVWLDDLRSGKPLPLAKRYELDVQRCTFTPRVQVGVAGGMLNVHDDDELAHRVRFIRGNRAGGDSLLALVRETDEGQVVPTEKVMARAGMVHVSCELHPWARAWIAVFDHPYFALTDRDGQFSIDSVPPGRYRLVTWHPVLGERTQDIEVQGQRVAVVSVEYP